MLERCKRAGSQVTIENLEGDRNCAQRHRQQQALAEVRLASAAEDLDGIDGSNAEASCHVGCQEHMRRLIRRARIEYRLEGIDACHLPMRNLEADRGIHPGVRADDKPRRSGSTDPEGKRTEPMRTRRKALPPIQVETEEDRLDEEGEPLQGKR